MNAVRCFQVTGTLAEVEPRVRTALAAQGFGILTEVDVRATLEAKLGITSTPYRILGACNPKLAHAALTAEPRVGAFLPCGIALYEDPSGATTTVCLQDPTVMSGMFSAPGLEETASEASRLLVAALAPLGTEQS